MMGLVFRAIRGVANAVALPVYTQFFLNSDVGKQFGLGLYSKLKLMRKIRRNTRRITSGTSWLEQLHLAAALLLLPQSMEGDVVECGSYKGSSAASLSLICSIVGRRLFVCDSFEGLPEVEPGDRVHVSVHNKMYEKYKKGDYAGRLEEVQDNIRKYGVLDRCQFIQGYFEKTLQTLDPKQKFAFIFLDVDLHASLRTCLTQLWPRLQAGGCLYTHEAQQLDFAGLFFDKQWWKETLGGPPPGLVGCGCGLPTGIGAGSALGYAIKRRPDYSVTADPGFRYFCGDVTQAASK
jgi:predicted O-methyltransferase YrrM